MNTVVAQDVAQNSTKDGMYGKYNDKLITLIFARKLEILT